MAVVGVAVVDVVAVVGVVGVDENSTNGFAVQFEASRNEIRHIIL